MHNYQYCMLVLKIKRKCLIKKEILPNIVVLFINIQKEQIDILYLELTYNVKEQDHINGNLEG